MMHNVASSSIAENQNKFIIYSDMENINGTNYARNIIEIDEEVLNNQQNFSPKVV